MSRAVARAIAGADGIYVPSGDILKKENQSTIICMASLFDVASNATVVVPIVDSQSQYLQQSLLV
jgi:hypothetical protein